MRPYISAHAGYRVSGTHANSLGLKTVEPPGVMWDSMRCWVAVNPSKKPFSLNCRIMHDSEDEALLTRRVQGVWDACQSPGAEDRCAGRGDVGYHALLVCRAPQQEAHGP